MHIRTDDEVYRVDAVWLGPPRATFPWRARYSAYGVGLLVMLVVMFLQRRLGIDLGFFSVAWALLITVAVTRFVSRRINDERPLLEWLTLFVHELRGPRARHRVTGGALTTGHVTVRRDRPRLTGLPTAVALPRGSDRTAPKAARPATVDPADDAAWGPPPRDDEVLVAEPVPEPAPTPGPVAEVTEEAPADTPGVPTTGPSHARAARPAAGPSEATLARRRARAERAAEKARAEKAAAEKAAAERASAETARAADADFGPPSSADVGESVSDGTSPTPTEAPAELPPVPGPRAGDAAIAAWTGARREAVPARRAGSVIRKADPDPDRTQRRATRPRRRPGWPMSNEPSAPATPSTPSDAPFGPGARSRDRRGDPGAAPR
ncbi:hypothetical protein [Actinomycetospora succinea]|uniref:hypothetical protein n=1 Tax=Actinomycetospora succinea TaxID=663603 RepID=UPI001AAD6411|nr:hypothetical protein [Actinomycetospora succinea]